MLSELDPDKVCFIIVKAREYEVSDEAPVRHGSNATDDDFSSALTRENADPVHAELRQFIAAMNDDERHELVALCWLGRGDFGVEEWAAALKQAAERAETPTADYLLAIPVLSDYLEEGLSLLELSCADFEKDRL